MVDPARSGRNAAALAILALSALVLTPLLFEGSIARQRRVYTVTLDPARDAASDVRLALAREVGAIRGYLLTRDRALLAEYASARRAQDSAFGRLAAVNAPDSTLVGLARRLSSATYDWNRSNDDLVAGRQSIEAAIDRLGEQQQKYRAALDEGETLEKFIGDEVGAMRERVSVLERRWALASVALAALGGAAALMVLLMMRLSHQQSTLARTDPLTGLFNRLGFEELATRELLRARRNGSAITLVTFDLDGFKQVNDARGHAAGDRLLRAVGEAIRAAVREIDVAARLGGDEFAMLLPDNRAEPPERAVERVRKVVADALVRGQWGVTLSVGAVTARGSDVSIGEMTQAADTLMYEVKHTGKDAMSHRILAADEGSDRPAPVHQSDDVPSRA
jgi:diguanylate cyclase (GGDEF)-like protein